MSSSSTNKGKFRHRICLFKHTGFKSKSGSEMDYKDGSRSRSGKNHFGFTILLVITYMNCKYRLHEHMHSRDLF
jgi:hypothetical protein